MDALLFVALFLGIPMQDAQASAYAMHLNLAAGVPIEYGLLLFDAAEQNGIDPLDLAAMLLSEHSGAEVDFSVEAGVRRGNTWNWTGNSEGSKGERGLFQLAPRHARKAGYSEKELWEPEPNIKTAARLIAYNQHRHQNCSNSWHTWVAHWKCASTARDDLEGKCVYAQRKWTKIRASLDNFRSESLVPVGRAFNQWQRERFKSYLKSLD